ncbi:hypothetical protein Ancab_031833 [Ancistrocladus abbreviatus]
MGGYWPFPYPPYFNEDLYHLMDEYLAEQDGVYVDSDEEEADVEEEEEEEEGGGEGEGEEEEGDDEVRHVDPPNRVSGTEASTSRGGLGEAAEREKERRLNRPITYGGEDSERSWNREDVEGLFCPICMEPWSNDGDHQPSCLPCGHLYGMSCIKKWLQQRKSSGKCPHCNKKCSLKDVRRIYGSRILVIDEESQKKIQSLEAKCDFLEKKDADWHKKEAEWLRREAEWIIQEAEWQKREANLCQKLQQLKEWTSNLECSLGDKESKFPRLGTADQGWQGRPEFGYNLGSAFQCVAPYSFALQKELRVDGCRIIDVDASSHILIIVRRPTGMGVTDTVTKMSLTAPHDQENILLPSAIKGIKGLHISPFGGLALLAGKKLSVLSIQSKNLIVSYDLPAPAWSCSWDRSSEHYMYAGLQNGMLLVFDTRQTGRALESRNGLSCNIIHTVHSLSDPVISSGVRAVLTASSVGVCQWNIGAAQELPFLIPEMDNQGVCISLAYCPGSDDIVATFRPKVETSNEFAFSQPIPTPSSIVGSWVEGSHVLIKRRGGSFGKSGSTFANVPSVHLPKSAIVGLENCHSLLAYGDEVTSNLVLRELPSLTVSQHFKIHSPVRDVKYTPSLKTGLLSCLSGDHLQLFLRKPL